MLATLYPKLRPLFFALEPERAHRLALRALELAHRWGWLDADETDGAQPADQSVELFGCRFPNRIGLAAGLDKNAQCVDALGALGFGFVEVGTVTPRPQAGQVRPRLFRLPEAEALINRMGFPNEGMAVVARRLATRRYRGVCGVNIGKNADTPIERAVDDYLECFRALAPDADYVTINVSSPNTRDLRSLQHVDQLRPLLEPLLRERERVGADTGVQVPLLVKLSPDLQQDELVAIAALLIELRIDGVIATNTTSTRPAAVAGSPLSSQTGGLSGKPLRPLALQSVRTLRAALGPAFPIVAAGGIDSVAAARDARAAGADLVQIYTGLIYRGPGLVRELREGLR